MSRAMFRRLLSLTPGMRDRLPPVVPVIRLEGMIAAGGVRRGLSLQRLAPVLDRAFGIPDIKAVALAINSPGGSPVQSSLIAARIRALAAEKEVKVHAFVEDVAASGGYWLACAADDIHADASSIVGSIGVISAGFGLQEAIDRLGIERRMHTAGKSKSLLDPFQPEKPEDLDRLRRILDRLHANFIAWVEERRQGKLHPGETELFDGNVWLGEEAETLGLIDGIGDLRSVLRARYGDKVKLPLIAPKRPLLPFLSGPGERLAERAVDAAADRIVAAQHWGRFGL